MSSTHRYILDEKGPLAPWSYSARIPKSASSRNYALLPLLAAILFGSMGAFLGQDVAHNVSFLSNASTWVTLALSSAGILLSMWMFCGRWSWTAPQMALLGFSVLAPFFWAFQGAPLFAFVIYSKTSSLTKAVILLMFLGWHGWWIDQTARRCADIWENVTLREKVWVPYEQATVYRRSAAKRAMDTVGAAWHPGPLGLLLPILLCVALYFFRYALVGYLDTPWVPMIGFVLGFTPLTLATTAMTFSSVAMLVIPARIVAATGKPVLVDMMTSATAPR
ncbi:MAG: hypothetical protein WAP57_12720 [Aquabacterium commune]|uniref:hypothetical protein n=1 Tax=Aquabacterium commune TaxID=70586 RepID=UPI003BB0D1FA